VTGRWLHCTSLSEGSHTFAAAARSARLGSHQPDYTAVVDLTAPRDAHRAATTDQLHGGVATASDSRGFAAGVTVYFDVDLDGDSYSRAGNSVMPRPRWSTRGSGILPALPGTGTMAFQRESMTWPATRGPVPVGRSS